MTEECSIQKTADDVNADAPAVSTNLLDADPEFRRLFKVRKVLKGKKPSFQRQCHHKFKRLTNVWRRPRGLQSKQRRGYKGKGAIATVGYGSPVLTKGLHPSGYDEVMVHNVDDLVLVDPEIEAVRIGGKVGGKKRAAIVEKCKEFNIKVLNPGKEE
ncbi:MAG: 50S ribosomal protein L32e [Methanosarcinales archaeon]|jgi:large subunit ribosomal protein L32e|nr:50S ribosomal protein L32e [Methanosarcinales archaeon]